MPAFVPLIAAGIGAAATVYATERSKAGGKGFAPAPDFGGGNRTPFQMPEGLSSTSLLGNQKAFNPTLSQTLENQGQPSGVQQPSPPPSYGPQGLSTYSNPYDQMALQQNIQGMTRGK